MEKLKNKIRLVSDVDGVICVDFCGDYENAEPIKENIFLLNKLYDKGVEVVYFTARGSENGVDWHDLTVNQFRKWGVKYSDILFGKPAADFYLDDKGYNVDRLESVYEKLIREV